MKKLEETVVQALNNEYVIIDAVRQLARVVPSFLEVFLENVDPLLTPLTQETLAVALLYEPLHTESSGKFERPVLVVIRGSIQELRNYMRVPQWKVEKAQLAGPADDVGGAA
jgi:hypothetical protein